jgi:L-ribulose-5-phosphate 3-epimerase
VRLLLHSMACPDRDPVGALALAHDLELDGVELIVQDGYRCGISPVIAMNEVRALARSARTIGSPIKALTPYTKGMNSKDPDARARALRELDHCLSVAAELGAVVVRIFGGFDVPAEDHAPALRRMGETLRQLGDRAQGLGVSLCIENHMDTMATSAGATMDILRAIDHPAYGVLYDQANLDFMRAEAFPAGFDLQKDAIKHVHVKDFRWDQNGVRKAALVGEGIVPWSAILAALATIPYSGYFTLEYERRWHPDQLPDAAIGCARTRDYLRSLKI